MKINPCFNKVLIHIVDNPEDIVQLPDNAIGPRTTYKVEAVGPDVKCCSVGDSVLLRPNTNMAQLARHLSGEDKFLTIVDDSTIFAVLETE